MPRDDLDPTAAELLVGVAGTENISGVATEREAPVLVLPAQRSRDAVAAAIGGSVPRTFLR